MNVGIIGCGKIGWKRAQNLGDAKLVAVADPVDLRTVTFAEQLGLRLQTFIDPLNLLSMPDIDAVIICTPHNMLAPLTLAAIKAGKHVLVEKPGGIHTSEVYPIMDAAAAKGVVVRVGYNLRFHPAMVKANALSPDIGAFMYIRGYYGHGGRPGYEKEWRFDEKQSGGGVLMDLGVHLIDLAQIFFGDMKLVQTNLNTYYWNTDLEDNAMLVLRQAGGQHAILEASCTEWKNRFSFEIVGSTGKLVVEGLGGTYGRERLTYYRMLSKMGPPETTIWEYSSDDSSWAAEFTSFIHAINKGNNTNMRRGATLSSALGVLSIVEEAYDHHKISA